VCLVTEVSCVCWYNWCSATGPQESHAALTPPGDSEPVRLRPDTVPAFNYFHFRHFLQLMWFVCLMTFNISLSVFTLMGQSESCRYFRNGAMNYHIQGTLMWVIEQSLALLPGCSYKQAWLKLPKGSRQAECSLKSRAPCMPSLESTRLNARVGTGIAFWRYRWLLSELDGVRILCPCIQLTFWCAGCLGISWVPSGTVSQYYRANLLTFPSDCPSASEEQSYFHTHFKSHYLILPLIFSSNKTKERLMAKQEFLVPWKQTFLLWREPRCWSCHHRCSVSCQEETACHPEED